MPTYKLWVQLERHNCEGEDCEGDTGPYNSDFVEYDNLGEPHDVGPFETYTDAIDAMNAMLALTGDQVDADLANEPEV